MKTDNKNKAMGGSPDVEIKGKAPEKEHFFPAQNGKPSKTIKAASKKEAEEKYNKK